MHKFLRTIGFSDIRRKDLEIILQDIIDQPDLKKITRDSEGNEFAEFSREYAPDMGIRVCGTYEEDDTFHMEYYFPYVSADNMTTDEQVEIQKHAEKESYAGICDDIHLGITLIFFVQNVADYLSENYFHKSGFYNGAALSALSTEGKILFPIMKRPDKEKSSEYKRRERNQLIAEARDGNEEAIESLTLEDMDTYSILSRRIIREDVLSIVSNYFMPYGIESDQYSILGDILDYYYTENALTKERICRMKIECNELIYDVSINEKDLLGQPAVGRRFKGNVWMQGTVCL